MTEIPQVTAGVIDAISGFETERDNTIINEMGLTAVLMALDAEDAGAETVDEERALTEYLTHYDAYTERARELFGTLNGYYLSNVNPDSISLSTHDRLHESFGPATEHTALTATVVNGKLSIDKTHFEGRVHEDLDVTERDRQHIAEAAIQIRGVTKLMVPAEA